MREADLVNVTKQTFVAPIGPWGGKAGGLFAENSRAVSSAIQPLVTSVFNVSKEEVERNCTLALEEFKTHHAYIDIYVYLGQKQ
jgi:hypothetical protein